MITRNQITLIGAAALIAGLAAWGCTGEKEENLSQKSPNIDSVVLAVSQQKSEPKPSVALEPKVAEVMPTDVATVLDVEIVDSLAFIANDRGLIVFNLKDNSRHAIDFGGPVNALAMFDGQLYAGADKLYRYDDSGLVIIDDSFSGTITALYPYGSNLMIGTDDGLYARTMLGCVRLMNDEVITAMVADNDGLWVGTDGDGLYRWDGEEFSPRFLARDSSLFDNVTALAFGHNHLYLGTSNGLWIHDGGSWQPVTTADGLPSDFVTAIDASGWIVSVGTDQGLVTYFDSQVKVVEPFVGSDVTTLESSSHGLIVGTATDGLFLQKRGVVKTLLEPQQDGSLAWEETE